MQRSSLSVHQIGYQTVQLYYLQSLSMHLQENGSNTINDTSKIQLNPTGSPYEEEDHQLKPVDQLELMIDNTNSEEDLKELKHILQDILGFPSSKLAEIHGNSMRLGNFDLESESKKAQENTRMENQQKMADRSQFCKCCSFKIQQEYIKICTSLDDISNMGTSTILFFVTFKNISILLAIMTVVYSVYALATNVIAAKNNALSSSYTVDYLTISLSSKESNNTSLNRTFYYIQAWLGMITVIIWILIFFLNKFREFQKAHQYDNDTISVSDYSIAIAGVPMDITHKEIQKSFTEYYESITSWNNIAEGRRSPLKVMKLNIGKPFYVAEDELKVDDELEKLEKELEEKKEEIRSWILERRDKSFFSLEKSKRVETYSRILQLIRLRNEKGRQIIAKIAKKLRENDRDELTTVFVTLETNIARNLMLSFNEVTLFSRLKSLCGNQMRYSFQRGEANYSTKIELAPQPEDIIWENIGHSSLNTNLRKIFTYTVTAILLGLCFMIVYFLSVEQQNQGNNRALSILISVVISLVNIILGQAIRFLTMFQKDYTSTNRQASLAIKSIVAQMINSILIPVITAYYIQTSTGVYQSGGLVDNIFMMSITNSMVPPLMLFINPGNLISKVIKCYKTRSSSKLSQTQKEFNILHEGVEFQVGYHYVYIVNMFMFVCFFVSLQPIVSVNALVGYLLMYWVQKYCLFNRNRRPVPGTDFVNKAVFQVVSFGPLIYSLGSLTWSNFDPNGIPPEALLPNLLSVAFSIVIIVLPINTLIENCCIDKDTLVKSTQYVKNRLSFPSEYDRINPSTSVQGMEEFKKFIDTEIDQKSEEEKKRIQERYLNGLKRGILNQAKTINPFSGFSGNDDFALNIAQSNLNNPAFQFASHFANNPYNFPQNTGNINMMQMGMMPMGGQSPFPYQNTSNLPLGQGYGGFGGNPQW